MDQDQKTPEKGSGKFLGLRHGVFRVASVWQPTRGGRLGGTDAHYDSGKKLREQGISKAGNRGIRTLAIEIAWAWLRYQPRSKLSQWFSERFAGGGTRMRRIGIMALARRLLIDLRPFLEYGVILEGALLTT